MNEQRRIQPRRAGSKEWCARLILLLGFCVWCLGNGTARARAESLSVGSAKQVFIDGRFIESSHEVELVVNRPRITGEMLLVPEHPWESGWIGDYLSVIQEGARIHMWYDSSDRQAITDTKNGMTGVAYAFSTDGGATWTKPKLGVIEYAGSRENNLVKDGVHGFQVFRNRPEAPLGEKYVLFSNSGRLWSSSLSIATNTASRRDRAFVIAPS